MIELNNVLAGYRSDNGSQVPVLKGLNLKVTQGEFVTIIGGNGAGKSTFMNVLAGDLIPFRGSVFFGDLDVTAMDVRRRSPYVARVFQDPRTGSFPDMSIEENLAIAYQRGKAFDFRIGLSFPKRRFFRDALAGLGIGLEDQLNTRMGSLSGGQRQAVSLVMACLCDCKLLLLDEHTAALDPGMAEKILRLSLEFVGKKNLTTFMITHSMQQALACGDRTLLLKDGAIAADLNQKERAAMKPDDLVGYF